MTALLLSIAICAAQPKELTWQQALDKIAPRMAGFKVSKDRYDNIDRFTELMRQAGLPAKDEDNNNDEPGFYLDWGSNVVKVKGSKSLVVRINRLDVLSEKRSGETVFALFEPDANRMSATILPDDDASEFSITKACQSGSQIVTVGTMYWFSNGPKTTVSLWKRSTDRWGLVSRKVAFFDALTEPELSVDRRGNIGIGSFVGRSYPLYLSACHATALRMHSQKVVVRNGKLHTAWLRPMDCPYNLLDRLYHATAEGRSSFITKSCANLLVAQHVFKLRSRTGQGTPNTEYVKSICDPFAKQIAVTNLRVWFHFDKKNGKWVVAKLSPYKERKL